MAQLAAHPTGDLQVAGLTPTLLHTEYVSSGPYGFSKEDFWRFLAISAI